MKRRWTTEELQYVRLYYGVKRGREVAAHLGRSLDAVRVKAHQLGIKARVTREPAEMDAHLRARWEATIEMMKQNLREELERND